MIILLMKIMPDTDYHMANQEVFLNRNPNFVLVTVCFLSLQL